MLKLAWVLRVASGRFARPKNSRNELCTVNIRQLDLQSDLALAPPPRQEDLDAVPPATLSDSPILRQRKVAPTAPPALNEDQTGAEETPLLQPLPKTVQGESSAVEQGQSSKTD